MFSPCLDVELGLCRRESEGVSVALDVVGASLEGGSPGAGSCSAFPPGGPGPLGWMATGLMGLLGFLCFFEMKLAALT